MRDDYRVRPKWWAQAMGLSSDSDTAEEPLHMPPPSPLLPWFPAKAQSDFRFMTWNILADILCRPQLFPYVTPNHMCHARSDTRE